jgi:hypothetical protein
LISDETNSAEALEAGLEHTRKTAFVTKVLVQQENNITSLATLNPRK